MDAEPSGGPSPSTSGPPPSVPPVRRRSVGVWVGVLVGGVVVAVVAGLLVWSPWSGGGGPAAQGEELWLEPAGSGGPDPFTESSDNDVVATTTTVAASTTTAVSSTAGPAALETVAGSTPGLYGGSQSDAACEVEAQIAYLEANADKAAAFAGVLGIAVVDVPDYVRSLRPVVLTVDTRVTNHGFVDGVATPRQAVLQAGTAVLIDRYGIPRVRCRCGNPLLPPLRLAEGWGYEGDGWDGFRLDQTVVIDIDVEIDVLILVDLDTGDWWEWPWRDGTTTTTEATTTTTTASTTTGLPPDEYRVCGYSPEEAVESLLAARRAGDRVGALMCGAEIVTDYLFRLDDAVAAGLTLVGCMQRPAVAGIDQGYECRLSNGATVYLTAPGADPATYGWLAAVVIVEGAPVTGR